MNEAEVKKGLSAQAKRLVDSILSEYPLAPWQMRILRVVGTNSDLSAQAEKEIKAARSLTFESSRGDFKEIPQIKTKRDADNALQRGLRELSLELSDDGAPRPRGDVQGNGAPRKPRLTGRAKRRS